MAKDKGETGDNKGDETKSPTGTTPPASGAAATTVNTPPAGTGNAQDPSTIDAANETAMREAAGRDPKADARRDRDDRDRQRNAGLRDRVRGLFIGQPPAMAFLGLMLAESAGPERTESILSIISPTIANNATVVGGKPAIHWRGKTLAQVKAELGDDEDAAQEVADFFEQDGSPLPDGSDLHPIHGTRQLNPRNVSPLNFPNRPPDDNDTLQRDADEVNKRREADDKADAKRRRTTDGGTAMRSGMPAIRAGEQPARR